MFNTSINFCKILTGNFLPTLLLLFFTIYFEEIENNFEQLAIEWEKEKHNNIIIFQNYSLRFIGPNVTTSLIMKQNTII